MKLNRGTCSLLLLEQRVVLTPQTELLGVSVDLIKQLTINDSMCVIGNLKSDDFSKLQSTTTVIRNMNDQVLFVDKRRPPVFEDMPDADQHGTFLCLFKSTETHPLLPTPFTAHIFKCQVLSSDGKSQ